MKLIIYTFLKCSTYFVFGCLCIVQPCYGQIWSEVAKVAASDRQQINWNGYVVSINGPYAISGAWKQTSDEAGGNILNESGAAYLIERGSNGNWSQVQKIVASDRTPNDVFGFSVAINNTTALVGAREERDGMSGDPSLTGAGSAYFFERDLGGDWQEIQKVAPKDRQTGDLFGWSLGLSGNYALISSNQNDLNINGTAELDQAGAAYFFMRNSSGTWTETQKVVATDRAAFDEFGRAVAISGSRAIIGAPWKQTDLSGSDDLVAAGGAYIFELDGNGNWTETARLIAPDRKQLNYFGWAVAIDGDYAAVGVFREAEEVVGNSLQNAGSVYVFERIGATWQFAQKLVASDRDAGDLFGTSISLSGEYLLIGAQQSDISNTDLRAGAAYIFKRNGAGVWEENQKIVASDREEDDSFGYSLAMDGSNIISGAYLEDDDASGGNPLDAAGSVYIFESDQVLGIEDEIFRDQIQLVPNPVLHTATLTMDNTFSDVDVRIVNLQGQVIEEMNFKGRQKFSFDTAKLKPGLYLVQLETAGNTASLKLLRE